MELDALEARDERERFSDAEIARLAASLQPGGDAGQQHRALLLLARCHTPDAEHALHALLEQPAEPEVAVLALQTLCLRWGLAERYAGVLRHFVRGVRWDIDRGGAVRRAAIAIGGEHLTSHTDTELMFDLIRISEDEPDEATRTAAVRALARATGYHGRPVDVRIDL